jgi:hypothetical protein
MRRSAKSSGTGRNFLPSVIAVRQTGCCTRAIAPMLVTHSLRGIRVQVQRELDRAPRQPTMSLPEFPAIDGSAQMPATIRVRPSANDDGVHARCGCWPRMRATENDRKLPAIRPSKRDKPRYRSRGASDDARSNRRETGPALPPDEQRLIGRTPNDGIGRTNDGIG